MKKIIIALFFVSLLPLGCGGKVTGVEKTKNFMQQLEFKREKKLSISNQNGTVAVQAQEGAEFATVSATIMASASTDSAAQAYLDKIEIRFAKQGDTLSVETVYPKAWTMKGKAKRPTAWNVDYTVIVPSGLDVFCTNVNGDVKIIGANEKVEIQNMNGAIVIQDNRKDIIATAVHGDIKISNKQDYFISLKTSTQNGSIDVDMPNAQMGQFSLSTLKGNVRMSIPSGYEPQIDLSNVEGDIEIILGERLSAKVELSTTNGEVKTNMVINTTTEVGGILEKKVIKGVVGGGIGFVKATTRNGNVTLNYGASSKV